MSNRKYYCRSKERASNNSTNRAAFTSRRKDYMFEIIRSKGKSAKRVVLRRPALPGEKGRAYRYKVPICIEARPASGERISEFAFFPAKDMSTTGFYFLSDALFPEKSKIEFVISYPRERADGMVELMRGTGKCVRVEKLVEGHSMRYGIGVHIEKSTSPVEKWNGVKKRR